MKGNLAKKNNIYNTFKEMVRLSPNNYNQRILLFLEASKRREEYHDLMVLYCLADTYDLTP